MTNTKMKSKIFKANEIISILSKEKTMFREVIKNQPCVELGSGTIERSPITDSIFYWKSSNNYSIFNFGECPYQVGQKIFCKERFKIRNEGIYYAEDEAYFRKEYLKVSPYKPAQHMKQEHSRLTLQIKSIGVERLADISEEYAIAEGFKPDFDWPWPCSDKFVTKTSKSKFIEYWNATHKKPEEKFEANQFVWKVQFEVINN